MSNIYDIERKRKRTHAHINIYDIERKRKRTHAHAKR